MSMLDLFRRKVLNSLYRLEWLIQSCACDECKHKLMDSCRIERNIIKEVFDRFSTNFIVDKYDAD